MIVSHVSFLPQSRQVAETQRKIGMSIKFQTPGLTASGLCDPDIAKPLFASQRLGDFAVNPAGSGELARF